MRGGKTLTDRGLIPRLLSSIYRRTRKIEKDTKGGSEVQVSMSYYEIYNDKVFDLFEAPENRTMAGLPLRDNGGKTVVVGLTERPCESLKEFEKLYDQANVNRSTSATKVSTPCCIVGFANIISQLNAHSSRSHAVLCVKLVVTTENETRTSMASAIDLAGSEDNRRTDNGKERLVESASINKSLFVLAQCVEAIGKKQSRIPYRESKMTRILSLGQNNGLTIMILNLAPVRSYHLDTLSSLNFANRTKKIEVREIENEPVFKGCSRAVAAAIGPSIQRQALRPLASAAHNSIIRTAEHAVKSGDKPTKAFSVYSDRSRPRNSNLPTQARQVESLKRSSPLKRPFDSCLSKPPRPTKMARLATPNTSGVQPNMSKAAIEDIIEKKVTEILAARALEQPSKAPVPEISEEVQRRLDLLEQKIEGKDDARAEGLSYLLMAKQHHVRGEDTSALKMYELAREYFPDNTKLEAKISKLREKLREKKQPEFTLKDTCVRPATQAIDIVTTKIRQKESQNTVDGEEFTNPDSEDESGYQSDNGFRFMSKNGKLGHPKAPDASSEEKIPQTPRTQHLLDIINTRDPAQIRLLKGVGAKKAEGIIAALCMTEEDEGRGVISSLGQLGRLKGVKAKTVENMRLGLGLSI